MKNLTNIAKATETITSADIESIINNADVDIETITDNEKYAVMIFAELEKALKTKEYNLVLDCNYSKSKNDVMKVDYYRLIDISSNTSLIQFYCHCNLKAQTCFFRLATSVAKENRERLKSECNFEIKINHKTNKYKHSERRQINYSDVVNVAKSVLSVLSNKEKAETKAE